MKKIFAGFTVLLFAVFTIFIASAFAEDNPIDAVETMATVTAPFAKASLAVAVAVAEEATLTPKALVAVLAAGESIREDKTAYVPGAPPAGDLMFVIDLTGSMGGVLGNAKVNSINIMNAVAGVIPDMRFGSISHMDADGIFGQWCGYGPTRYGQYDSYGDYQYSLDQSLTASTASVATAINGLSLGWGADGPESYKTAIERLYADGSIGWSSTAKKIAVLWGDNLPHDCAIGTGEEPGLVGTSMATIMANLATANITPIFLHSGGSLAYWQGMAALAGGSALQVNSDGTIPGVDVAQLIADLIEAEVSIVDEFTLEACDSTFDDWLTSVSPSSYISVEPPATMKFDIVVTVPEGTEDDVYCFDICLVGDGVVYATQYVCIFVIN